MYCRFVGLSRRFVRFCCIIGFSKRFVGLGSFPLQGSICFLHARFYLHWPDSFNFPAVLCFRLDLLFSGVLFHARDLQKASPLYH